MNSTLNLSSIQNCIYNTQLIDRLLSIYSLLLILIGTPCNLLCCMVYFQKANRLNSIKMIFGYLAFLDTIVLYTFNFNYVFREFKTESTMIYRNNSNDKNCRPYVDEVDSVESNIIKRNLEERSLAICRLLSYFGKKN